MNTLRLAMISTPRSGNSWLRHMLSQMYELEEIVVHRPREVPWDSLPCRAILQLHWAHQPDFVSLLEEHGFRVVVISRHPLDTLISMLVFSQHDESTLKWLDGAGGDERGLAGASPTSNAFMSYATGPRAKALLGVSAQWWPNSDCRVRYEDLVSDTPGELARIQAALGEADRKSPEQVAARATPQHMRTHSVHMLYHVWQAKAGLWKQLLPARAARHICAAQADILRTLDYVCDPNRWLSASAAQAAWDRFDVAGLKHNVVGIKDVLCQSVGQQAIIDRQREALENLTRQVAELERARVELERQIAALPWEQMGELAGFGPWSLGAARALQRLSHGFPRLARAAKSLVLLSRRSGGLTFKWPAGSANFASPTTAPISSGAPALQNSDGKWSAALASQQRV